MIADQLRRDKNMLSVKQASIKAMLENVNEESTKLREDKCQFAFVSLNFCKARVMMSLIRPIHESSGSFEKISQQATRTSSEGQPNL